MIKTKDVLILDYTNPETHIEYETESKTYPIKSVVDHGLFSVFEF